MKFQLNDVTFQKALQLWTADLETQFEMYFTADWEETRDVINRLSGTLGKFEQQLTSALGAPNPSSGNNYILRVSEERCERISELALALRAEIDDLGNGASRLPRHWQGTMTAYCMIAYLDELREAGKTVTVGDLTKVFYLGTKANGVQNSQGMVFVAKAQHDAIKEFAGNRAV